MIANFDRAIKKAQEIRSQNFILSPSIDIREIAKNYGLSVVEINFEEKFENIAGWIKGTTIYVNIGDSANRKKFTVAHELGHYLLHQKELTEKPNQYAVLFRIPIGANTDPIEKEANCFAANLLVPGDLLIEYYEKQKKSVAELADIFEVSQDVIGYRIQILEKSPLLNANGGTEKP